MKIIQQVLDQNMDNQLTSQRRLSSKLFLHFIVAYEKVRGTPFKSCIKIIRIIPELHFAPSRLYTSVFLNLLSMYLLQLQPTNHISQKTIYGSFQIYWSAGKHQCHRKKTNAAFGGREIFFFLPERCAKRQASLQHFLIDILGEARNVLNHLTEMTDAFIKQLCGETQFLINA